jgi:hypothetical protein
MAAEVKGADLASTGDLGAQAEKVVGEPAGFGGECFGARPPAHRERRGQDRWCAGCGDQEEARVRADGERQCGGDADAGVQRVEQRVDG